MLNWETITDTHLGETYYRAKHPAGPEVQVCPKPGYTSAYAMFSTKYGAIDTAIVCGNSVTELPEGTAHFLEHKLFEDEGGEDAFTRFKQTGASPNAYTSFDQTCYLFSCATEFRKNFEILLDFVQSPYFTEATVQKEQGIIGQEIRMLNDYPSRNLFFGLLKLLYPNHPVRIEVAGTEASIANITAELLHDCYRHFYNLHNMVITVAGNVTLEEVEAVCDEQLKPCEGSPAVRPRISDPAPPAVLVARYQMAVTVPLFTLGFKQVREAATLTAHESAAQKLALDILASETSPLYEQLLNDGLINANFGSEILHGDDYAVALFSGESHKPEQTAERIVQAMLAAQISETDFERARKRAYGRLVMECNDIETIADRMTESYFAGCDLFARARALRDMTLEDVQAQVPQMFREGYHALSIVEPI
ncbi:MAG: insulinase family protein [Oscillospiraceae bacterium]|nr:insulinase family protein [Oscillospiraceae bacterium]